MIFKQNIKKLLHFSDLLLGDQQTRKMPITHGPGTLLPSPPLSHLDNKQERGSAGSSIGPSHHLMIRPRFYSAIHVCDAAGTDCE